MMGDHDTELKMWRAPSGEELFIDFEDSDVGSKEPFYVVYLQPDGTQRYGWFCSNCGSADTAMDPMGTIKCNHCRNRRDPTGWDAAYL